MNTSHSPPEVQASEHLSPSEFARSTLGITTWSKMEDIFRAVEEGKRKILVRSCNGAGKTTAIAALCNWKLEHFREAIVLTTASSWTQVKKTLWGEIRKQARRADLHQGAIISDASIRIDDKHYAIGISPAIPENAQGFHAPNMLIAVDEATGVNNEIVNALWGNATSEDTQMIMIYNPIDTTSFPYEAEESGEWHLITISAFEHPNVIEGREVIPGAVTREWIEDRMKSWSYLVEPGAKKSVHLWWCDKWYARTALVESRILGEWPDDGSEGFITMDLLKRSITSEVTASESKAIGVDIARTGEDSTTIAFFTGNIQTKIESFVGKDLMKTAGRIAELYHEGWSIVTLDDTGIGSGVTDKLKELNIPCHAINFAQKPKGLLRNRKELLNARAEMYFLLEEELRNEEIRLLDDRAMQQEIAAIRLSTHESSTRYKMEDKESVRRRLGRSPDRADATALARYGLAIERHRPVWFF